MTTLSLTLTEREREFQSHLALAQALEARLLSGDPISIGETSLTVRHLRTIKSGLIVHLYNIVEALMTRTMEEVSGAVRISPPEEWSTNTLKEWLRFNASIGLDGNEESRLDMVHKAALKLLKAEPIHELRFKKPSGSWTDGVIATFSRRLNVRFILAPDLAEEVRKSARYGDKTPLEFLADRRNAIAHGRRSFEDGAVDLSLADIHSLASVTIRYLEQAIRAFQDFVDSRQYLSTNAAAVVA